MNKYIPIKSILNYIPNSIREETGDVELIKYAFQGLRQNNTKRDLLQGKLELIPLNKHKAYLQGNNRLLYGVYYLSSEQANKLAGAEPYFEVTDTSEAKSFLSETSIIPNSYLSEYAVPLEYKGKDSYIVKNNYLSYYDECCVHGFTVDHSLTCITTDIEEGFLLVEKMEFVQNTDGEYLIPDDANLQQGLGYYAEAMAWRERSGRKEQGAEQMFQQRLSLAQGLFNSARGKRMLERFEPNKMAQLVFSRFLIQQIHSVTGEYKNSFL